MTTSKMDEAAYLFLRGFQLNGGHTERGMVYFDFQDDEDRGPIVVQEFYDNATRVNPRDYAAALRRVRDYFYEIKQRGSNGQKSSFR